MTSDTFDEQHKPFRASYYPEFGWTYYCNAPERIAAVKRMTDPAELHAALQVPDLQLTVRRAIERRAIERRLKQVAT